MMTRRRDELPALLKSRRKFAMYPFRSATSAAVQFSKSFFAHAASPFQISPICHASIALLMTKVGVLVWAYE